MSEQSPGRRTRVVPRGTSRPACPSAPPSTPPSDNAASAEAPMLHWLLEMLACLSPSEGLDVVLRPGGDRRRECKVHVPAGERGLLGVVLELLGGKSGGVGVESHGQGVESGDVGVESDESDDAPDLVQSDRATTHPTTTDLYTLEVEILRVLTDAGRPLAGKVVAARLGRKYSGWVKACLSRLVKLGLLGQGAEGYVVVVRGDKELEPGESDDGR